MKYVICLAAIILTLILAQSVLLPFVYKIKEPCFAMPVEVEKKPHSIEDLPIRHDAYGNGEFGARRKSGKKHSGLDLAAKAGTPVYASKSGWARTHCIPTGYGNLVVINHPGPWQTRYGHLHKTAIKKSQWVKQGGILGSVGKTGNANLKGIIPHLHFEIRHKGKPLDPAKELVRNEYKAPRK